MTIEKPVTVEDDIRAAMASLKAAPEGDPAPVNEPDAAPEIAESGDVEAIADDEPKEGKGGRERGPDGKFKAKDAALEEPVKAAVDKPDGQAKAEGDPAQTPPADVPAHWSAQDRAAFAKVPPESREWVMGRLKAMEADHTRKSMEAAEIRKQAAPILDIFAPYRDQLALNGMTEAQVVQRWAAAEKFLQSDGPAAVKWLAGQYGVDLAALAAPPEEAAPVDPHIAEIRKELSTTRQTVEQFQAKQNEEAEARARAAVEANGRIIQEFADAIDAEGKLSHPHFNDVLDDMLALAKAEANAGRTPDLQALYERAIWASPVVRPKLLEAQRSAAAREIEQKAKEKAERARAAGSSVRDGAAGPPDPVPVMALRDELRERLRDARTA